MNDIFKENDYKPSTGVDNIIRNGCTFNVTAQYMAVTMMDKYNDKSFEELHLEDYKAPKLWNHVGAISNASLKISNSKQTDTDDICENNQLNVIKDFVEELISNLRKLVLKIDQTSSNPTSSTSKNTPATTATGPSTFVANETSANNKFYPTPKSNSFPSAAIKVTPSFTYNPFTSNQSCFATQPPKTDFSHPNFPSTCNNRKEQYTFVMPFNHNGVSKTTTSSVIFNPTSSIFTAPSAKETSSSTFNLTPPNSNFFTTPVTTPSFFKPTTSIFAPPPVKETSSSTFNLTPPNNNNFFTTPVTTPSFFKPTTSIFATPPAKETSFSTFNFIPPSSDSFSTPTTTPSFFNPTTSTSNETSTTVSNSTVNPIPLNHSFTFKPTTDSNHNLFTPSTTTSSSNSSSSSDNRWVLTTSDFNSLKSLSTEKKPKSTNSLTNKHNFFSSSTYKGITPSTPNFFTLPPSQPSSNKISTPETNPSNSNLTSSNHSCWYHTPTITSSTFNPSSSSFDKETPAKTNPLHYPSLFKQSTTTPRISETSTTNLITNAKVSADFFTYKPKISSSISFPGPTTNPSVFTPIPFSQRSHWWTDIHPSNIKKSNPFNSKVLSDTWKPVSSTSHSISSPTKLQLNFSPPSTSNDHSEARAVWPFNYSHILSKQKTNNEAVEKQELSDDELVSSTINCIQSLNMIIYRAQKSKLIGVCENFETAKSNILKSALIQIRIANPRFMSNDKCAFVSESSSVLKATVKDNILDGKPFRAQRYYAAIALCCLKKDIDSLVLGDLTKIGDDGVNLSDAQKQKIALARVFYANKDIYIFNNAFNKIDTKDARFIFESLIAGALKEKIVILIDNQFSYLRRCDIIYILNKGNIVEENTHHYLMTTNKFYASFVKNADADNNVTDNNDIHDQLSNQNENPQSLVTQKTQDNSKVNESSQQTEDNSIETGTYKNDKDEIQEAIIENHFDNNKSDSTETIELTEISQPIQIINIEKEKNKDQVEINEPKMQLSNEVDNNEAEESSQQNKAQNDQLDEEKIDQQIQVESVETKQLEITDVDKDETEHDFEIF
ncbi:uncharacterized protein LOC130676288 [Microplitis mediator]|uniref:uncharacterized protein LOC130676288 n=1 Tax=Microplitis mediator TaxID=375433 RepID=UPI00255294D1|nr:uncharacterized protein LOC130676288 [Microplitis mediator]XP_057338419.1 uncharacterized protein LOC130676288 [Microplitis mediator]XP_057338420.1 uncharacterized protein LOC130676288 [Microplitis mediator]